MQQNPILFVEINETNFIFVAFRYDNNQNLKIIPFYIGEVMKDNITLQALTCQLLQ